LESSSIASGPGSVLLASEVSRLLAPEGDKLAVRVSGDMTHVERTLNAGSEGFRGSIELGTVVGQEILSEGTMGAPETISKQVFADVGQQEFSLRHLKDAVISTTPDRQGSPIAGR
jgi:hypothetical protein